MPTTYPAVTPTLTGDVLDINRFLQTPTLIQRALRTIAQQRFVGDFLLQGRGEAQGGAVIYEQNESIYPDRNVEAVEPGAEFPLTPVGTGPALLAGVKKWGIDTLVTDEAITRFRFNVVDRALTKLANGVIKQVDSVALAAISAAVTSTQAAAFAWSNSSAKILRDILTAVATINARNQGYNADTLVVDDQTAANLMSDATITTALRRETVDTPVYSGELMTLAGLTIAVTPNLPTTGRALVLDRTVLGSMIDEQPLGSRSMREDENERWRLRAKRIVVPIVQEPLAAVSITGV